MYMISVSERLRLQVSFRKSHAYNKLYGLDINERKMKAKSTSDSAIEDKNSLAYRSRLGAVNIVVVFN